MNPMNRRHFILASGAAICAGVCGCAGTGGPLGEAWTGPTRFDLGPIAAIRPGVDTHWAEIGGFFVVRDQSRIAAVSSICSHRRCPLTFKTREYICDCHGSKFTPSGIVQLGPAVRSLPHFGILLDAAGQVIVNRAAIFEEARWADPGAWIEAGKS